MNRHWIILSLRCCLLDSCCLHSSHLPMKQVRSVSAPGLKPDPSGANTGGVADVVGASRGAPTMDEMKKPGDKRAARHEAGGCDRHGRIAINFIWTLICGFLVFFMQAGFAMMETGFTRTKNAGHTMAMNMMVFVFGILGYWVCGYAFQMGGADQVSCGRHGIA